jgi:hypothetical protein
MRPLDLEGFTIACLGNSREKKAKSKKDIENFHSVKTRREREQMRKEKKRKKKKFQG